MVPMLTSMFKSSISRGIEKGVEKNLTNLINKIAASLNEIIGSTANPRFLKSLTHARDKVLGNEFSQVYQKRQEKLE